MTVKKILAEFSSSFFSYKVVLWLGNDIKKFLLNFLI